jgi:hypothetical protein
MLTRPVPYKENVKEKPRNKVDDVAEIAMWILKT